MGRRRNSSEQEDDPEPFQDSGSDFDVEEAKREESGRRKSSRASKKSKKSFKEESGSDEDEDLPEPEDSDSEEEEAPKRKRKTPAKKGAKANSKASPKAKKKPVKKVKEEEEDEDEEDGSGDNEEENGDGEDNEEGNGKEAGSNDSDSSQGKSSSNQNRGIHRKFIPKTIYSEDYATGSFVILKKDAHTGAEKHPCIWRIDGKALLQKYEAFDEDEKVRHKNTSIYTGWSPLDKDLYAPITVDVVRHNNNNLTVEVHWDKLKDIQVDSE